MRWRDRRRPCVTRMGPLESCGCLLAANELTRLSCRNLRQLCAAVHGFSRGFELRGAIEQKTASVVQRNGSISGYSTALGFRGHAVANTTNDLKALIASAPAVLGPGFYVPIRNGDLLRWLFDRGFRASWPAALITIGPYRQSVLARALQVWNVTAAPPTPSHRDTVAQAIVNHLATRGGSGRSFHRPQGGSRASCSRASADEGHKAGNCDEVGRLAQPPRRRSSRNASPRQSK